MVNRKNTNVARDIDRVNENESSTQLLSTRQPSLRERTTNDDLIGSLANAYENKRARQVSEWERVGFQNIYRT
jgi:hypothetical protein